MNKNTAQLVSIALVSILGGIISSLGGYPRFGLSIAVLGCAPIGFIGLLFFGIYADKTLGVDDAWAYTLPTGKDD